MRSSGVLMHMTSLPSPGGVGTMGEEARAFVDFLVQAGQSYWQLLPLGPTSYGDSPYQSFSAFAGSPYLIDLRELEREGLLEPGDYTEGAFGTDPARVDYGLLYAHRLQVLRKAVERFLKAPPEDYPLFLAENRLWLPTYALFMSLKEAHGGRPWWEWEEGLRRRNSPETAAARRELAGEVAFWQAVQYLFFHQWRAMKGYANQKGIHFIGDLPIYVALDSADVWGEPELFQLGEELLPTQVAGVPPDAFSEDGQLWGNPLFNWENMKADGYRWWIERIRRQRGFYDLLRLDHFRGFSAYYAIPYGAKTAKGGHWEPGPGLALFQAVEEALGPQPIVAEDLGLLTPEVYQLLEDTGYPGMKVLQFAFDGTSENPYLPHNYDRHCVAYVGTHDNDTALGWLSSSPPEVRKQARDYLNLTGEEGAAWGLMRGMMSSPAELVIVTAQDLLELGGEGRMNEPSTIGKNWTWRARPGAFSAALAQRLRRMTELFGRVPVVEEASPSEE